MQIMDRSSLLYWYGVEIGEGAVVGATAAVYKSLEPWSAVGGNPCKIIKVTTQHPYRKLLVNKA